MVVAAALVAASCLLVDFKDGGTETESNKEV